MNLLKSIKLATATVATACIFSTSAFAASTTWEFGRDEGGKNYAGNNSQTAGSSGNQATATAWSSFSTSGSASYQSAVLSFWGGGVGVGDSNSPNHAVDNQYADEFVLLYFDQAVNLKSVEIGWPDSNYDTDMTILAYNGAGSATPSGKTAAQMLASGWTHVDDLFNIATDTPISIDNGTNISSNYWLVGAYNEYLSPEGSRYRGAKDFFKLKAVTGTSHMPPSTNVPLPTTAALFGLGLILLGRKKRINK